MSRALSFGNQEDPAAPAAMRYESTLSDVVVMEGPALLCGVPAPLERRSPLEHQEGDRTQAEHVYALVVCFKTENLGSTIPYGAAALPELGTLLEGAAESEVREHYLGPPAFDVGAH